MPLRKPVYPDTTIGVKLTVVEKIAQERREPEDVAKGIVRYRVQVDDHEGDVVAVATMTMVKKRDQVQMAFDDKELRLQASAGHASAFWCSPPAQPLCPSRSGLARFVGGQMQPDPFIHCGESTGLKRWMTQGNVGWERPISRKWCSPTSCSRRLKTATPLCRPTIGFGMWSMPLGPFPFAGTLKGVHCGPLTRGCQDFLKGFES